MLQPAVGEGVNIGPEEKIATRLAGRQTDMATRPTDMTARQTDMAGRQTDTVQKTGMFFDSNKFLYLDIQLKLTKEAK